MNELRNGRMSEGRTNLERAFAGDPYDIWTKNTLDLLDTLDLYPETTSPRFRFFIDGTESELLSLYLSDIAEEAYDRMSVKYGYEPPAPIRVEVFPDEVDFSVRTVGLVGLRALGVSFGPVVAIISPSAKGEDYFNWGSTLWHELAHTFHMGVSEFKVPRWFTEGLSVLEERRARPGWGDDVSPGFLAAYLQGNQTAAQTHIVPHTKYPPLPWTQTEQTHHPRRPQPPYYDVLRRPRSDDRGDTGDSHVPPRPPGRFAWIVVS